MTQPKTTEKVILKAEPRETFGKQTRSLRKNGMTPGNIYGKNFDSVAISLETRKLHAVYKSSGETTVVYVQVGENEYPTLFSDLQFHPVTGEVLHVDLKKVNLRQKVEASVPLSFVGESEAVERKNGVLLTQMTEVTVSALPAHIPHEIEVELSALAEISDMIRIGDLPKVDGYEIMDEADRVIVSVSEHVEEAIEPETTAEAPEIITEAAPEAGDGDTSTPGKKQE